MAIGSPNGIPFSWIPPVKTASDIESSPNLRISADGGVSEFSNGCLDGRAFSLVQASPVGVLPSLLIVPQSYKSGKLYAQLPNARVNHIPNNSMFGASGGVLPSGWTFSVGAASGVSLGYSASGQVTAEDGTLVDYIDFTFSGTATASGFLNLRPNASPSTISSVSGQSWNASVYFQLISGSVASISPTYQLQETTSGGTFINGSNITGLGSLTTSLPLRRYNVTRDLDTSGTVVTCRWGHSIASGTTYNYTLRIASPQLENLSSPTSVIRTVSGAVYAPYSGAAPGGSTIASIADFTVTRATTATRVNSSGLIESVASGVPRIDWLGQSCPALLVEPSAQNLARHSENWTSTNNWQLSDGSGRVTVVNATSGTTAPDGTSTANAITPTSGNIQHYFYSNASGAITYVSGTIYTLSAFFKKGAGDSGRYVQVSTVGGARFNNPYANFDLELGTTLTVSGSTSDANRVSQIQNYGNGWYRCSLTATCVDSGTSSVGFVAALLTGDTNTRLGTTFAGNTSDYIFGWGAQVETGAIPTSYIPTTTGSGSRAADVISASGALVSGLIGATEGTIYAEVDIRNLGVVRSFINVQDSSYAGNAVRIECNASNQFRIQIRAATASALDQTITSPTFTTGINKVAMAYNNAASGVVFAFNGSIIYTSASAVTMPSGMDRVHLGTRFLGTYDLFFNDRIRAAALYTTRLTNDQLEQLTRL